MRKNIDGIYDDIPRFSETLMDHYKKMQSKEDELLRDAITNHLKTSLWGIVDVAGFMSKDKHANTTTYFYQDIPIMKITDTELNLNGSSATIDRSYWIAA